MVLTAICKSATVGQFGRLLPARSVCSTWSFSAPVSVDQNMRFLIWLTSLHSQPNSAAFPACILVLTMVCTCRCFILLAFLSCSAWSAFRGASRVRRPTSDAFRPGVKPGKVPSSSVKLPQAAPPTTGTDRLQKVIAMAGLGSRRSAETMVRRAFSRGT
jgi:hypothetical protein